MVSAFVSVLRACMESWVSPYLLVFTVSRDPKVLKATALAPLLHRMAETLSWAQTTILMVHNFS